MLATRTTMPDERLLRRQCVACGYDGALLRGGLARRCARCGCDLRRRPARSYVEMEGLTVEAPRRLLPAGAPILQQFQARIRKRWLAFLCLASIGLVVTIYLSAAAFSV